MKYSELIEGYKNHALDAEEYERVRRDIERHEAISEYLFEREEEDTLFFGKPTEAAESMQLKKSGLRDGGDCTTDSEQENNMLKSNQETEIEFARRVNRTIRKAFIRMGVIVGASTLAVVLFIFQVLPELVASFYYDPEQVVGENLYGGETNRMSLDMAVYSELYLPGYYRYYVQTEDRGYGNYDIVIRQNVSYTGKMTDVAGRVERSGLKLYDVNQFRPVTGNAFGWFQISSESGDHLSDLADREGSYFFSAAGKRDQATETLEGLDENMKYVAYVTLDQMMDYQTFLEFIDAQEGIGQVWCAPCTSDPTETAFRPANLGFYLESGVYGTELSWNRLGNAADYPELVIWSGSDDEAEGQDWERAGQMLRDESFAAEHFAVMLDYMSDQDRFAEMMDLDQKIMEEAADYVRENGLTVYGFAAVMDKEEMLKLNEQKAVYEIYTQELH